ncbi:MAG: hypothetical protein AAGI51_13110 [Pseudomonadota bacterium]
MTGGHGGRPAGRRLARLDLHIGTAKTGTTSIQAWLRLNRAALAERSVFTPALPLDGNHWWLAAAFAPHERLEEFWLAQPADDAAGRDLLSRRTLSTYADAARGSGCARAVLSSEHLHDRLLTRDGIAALKAWVDALFDEVRVILVVRDPLELMLSQKSTDLRGGEASLEVAPPDSEDARRLCDHAASIRRWADVFGEEALRVRRFAPGASVEVFDAALGGVGAGLAPPPRENESFSRLGAEVLARCNALWGVRGPQEMWSPRRGRLLRLISGAFAEGPRLLPDRDAVLAYDAAFARSNEAVRARWFPERERLFDRDPRHQAALDGAAPPRLEVEDAALDMIAAALTRAAEELAAQDKARRDLFEGPGGLALRALRRARRLAARLGWSPGP